VKTQQAGKGIKSAMVICELWRLAVTLLLLVITSRVYKWPINPFTSQTPSLVIPLNRDNILNIRS
jgi:hypothetical protein